MFYCCGTLLVFLSVRDRVYNTQNADNSAQSNTKYHDLPLAFVRSGHVNLDFGFALDVGEGGLSRSRTASNYPTYAYYLYFAPTGVASSGSDNRDHGIPLRCLYPGSA